MWKTFVMKEVFEHLIRKSGKWWENSNSAQGGSDGRIQIWHEARIPAEYIPPSQIWKLNLVNHKLEMQLRLKN